MAKETGRIGSPKRKILLYGTGREGDTGSAEKGDFLVYSQDKYSALPFNLYDLTIVFGGFLTEKFEGGVFYRAETEESKRNRKEAGKRVKDVQSSLEKGKHVCVLVSAYGKDIFVDMLLEKFGVTQSDLSKSAQYTNCKAKAFDEFIKSYGTTNVIFSRQPGMQVISEDPKGGVVAFALSQEGSGKIIFLPCVFLLRDDEYREKLLTALYDSAFSYLKSEVKTVPQYIYDVRLPGEEEILEQEKQHVAKIKEISLLKSRFMQLKEGLVAGGDELVSVMLDAFKAAGIEVWKEEKHPEDFWLVSGGYRSVLVHVAEDGANLRREHVRKADHHREEYLPNDDRFPVLLIINSFTGVKSWEEKNVEIGKWEIPFAVKMNVFVMRTTDLLEMSALFSLRTLTIDDFFKLILQGGGWLRVKDGKLVLVTE
jgi:hypothetical protein